MTRLAVNVLTDLWFYMSCEMNSGYMKRQRRGEQTDDLVGFMIVERQHAFRSGEVF